MNILNTYKTLKEKIFIKENIYCLVLIIIIFFFDRYTKSKIINNLEENKFYINDFLNFELIWNTGIGFGLMKFDSALVYNLITTLIALVIIILIYFALKGEKLDKLILSIIIGGALGNFYDRIFYNAVPDFIDLHYQNFHWFTFNLADIFITIGIIAYIVKDINFKKKYE